MDIIRKVHHKHVRGKDGLYHCPYCDRKIKNQNTLSSHIRAKHNEICGWPNKHNCPHCDYSSNLKTCLNQHIDRHHRQIKKSCSLCEKSFKLNGVYSHMYNIHISISDRRRDISAYKQGRILFEKMCE